MKSHHPYIPANTNQTDPQPFTCTDVLKYECIRTDECMSMDFIFLIKFNKLFSQKPKRPWNATCVLYESNTHTCPLRSSTHQWNINKVDLNVENVPFTTNTASNHI